MTTPRQAKSGAKKPRKKPRAANGANGKTEDARAIGAVVDIGAEDRKTIATKKLKLADAERRLGQLRAKFVQDEGGLLADHQKHESEYSSLVRTIAEKLKLTDGNEGWAFDPDKMTFTRTR